MHTQRDTDATFAWDQYWRDGRLASCGGAGGVNYQPVIAEGWRRFFATFPHGTRVLDVCSGNGAVARLAAEVASSRGTALSIDAVDAAAIQPPPAGPGVGMIRFLPRTPAEQLPFADGSFDAIVGQYGIEYTDMARTLAELHRVSRPAVRLRFVLHATDSVVVQEAARQIADAQRLTATGIFEAADALARTDPRDPAATDAARRRFRDALRTLQAAALRADDRPMYQNIGGVIVDALQREAQVGKARVLDKIAETAVAIRAHEARLAAMRRAALDAAALRRLAESVGHLWSRTCLPEPLVRADGAKFGWTLSTRD